MTGKVQHHPETRTRTHLNGIGNKSKEENTPYSDRHIDATKR